MSKEILKESINTPLNVKIVNKSDGSRHVIIGKISEDSQLDRIGGKLEGEESYVNAEEYVKKNKKIAVPAESVPEEIKKLVGNGWVVASSKFTNGTRFIFIDTDGSIAEVNIEHKKIKSLNSLENLIKVGTRLEKRDGLLAEELLSGDYFEKVEQVSSPLDRRVKNIIEAISSYNKNVPN